MRAMFLIIGLNLSLVWFGASSAQTAPFEAPAASQSQAEGQSDRRQASSSGAGDYCGRDLGRWFYCQRPEPEPEEAQRPDQKPSPLKLAKPKEIAELEAWQKDLEEARSIAVWRPTPQTVERYYKLQQVALDRGGLFADYYRRLTWTNPDYDYTAKRPVVEVGKHGWTDDRAADRDLFLRGISSRVGVFYVYRANCGPCSIASPIVRAFSDRFGVTVRAISSDGSANSHFPQAIKDTGQLAAWGVGKTTPVILFYQQSDLDPQTGLVRPRRVKGSNGQVQEMTPCDKPAGCLTYAGAGVMSLEDIAERLFVLLSKAPGTDF